MREKKVKKELKKDQKKHQNRMKNATIEIVAGHSEQNEPVFVCLGREYKLVRKRPKKSQNGLKNETIRNQNEPFEENTSLNETMRV